MSVVISTTKNITSKLILPLLLLLVASLAPVPVFADAQILQDRAVEFLLQINQARRDPLACAERLGIDEETVRTTFADQSWILDQGLPPLAWNNQLVSSAATHGRDMFDRLYYSYITPEGATVEQRINATGYQAAFVGETMNALFFVNYVPVDDALRLLVDSMLRDELSGNPDVEMNIFSPDVSEVGISFFAESINLSGRHPHVYLLLADFASPFEKQNFVIIEYDQDSRVVARTYNDQHWIYPQQLRPGVAQMPFPEGGAQVLVIGDNGLGGPARFYSLNDWQISENIVYDIRHTEK